MPLPTPADAPTPQLFSLAGKTVLVTGGSRGIGLALVQAYAEAGAGVAFTYASSRDAEATAKTVAADTGARVQAYQANVRDRDAVAGLIAGVRADFGALDVVVLNAGVNEHRDALDVGPDDFKWIMETNVDGVFWTAQAAGAAFKEQGHGNLIVTASVSATLVNVPQRQAPYNASKAAALQLARSLAVEWAGFARVNVVSPGFIATDMINDVDEGMKQKWLDQVPAERFCNPHELKGVFVFLASDASSYMTGANLIVDGGYSLP